MIFLKFILGVVIFSAIITIGCLWFYGMAWIIANILGIGWSL